MNAIENCLSKARNLGSLYNNKADVLCAKAAAYLPERVFRPYPWERFGNGILYTIAGVEILRKFVCNRGEKKEGFALKVPTLEQARTYVTHTKRHEVHHTIQAFVGLAGATISSQYDNSLLMLGCIGWTAGNLWITALQRSLRGRAYRIIDRANKRKK